MDGGRAGRWEKLGISCCVFDKNRAYLGLRALLLFVFVCLCVFIIKLHVTAQSGPVILVTPYAVL